MVEEPRPVEKKPRGKSISRPEPPSKAASPEEAAARNRDRIKRMASAMKDLGGSRPASEVLRRIEAVPTLLPHLDYKLGLGGYPIARVTVVHGPSNAGKSALALALIKSFLVREHYALFVDAERSTDELYARQMLGDAYDLPTFRAVPVSTYEQARQSVRAWADRIAESRAKGLIDEDATGIVVVDSLKSLMPASIFDELAKATKELAKADKPPESEKKSKKPRFREKGPKGHVDGVGGRAGQLQAAYNGAWFTELVSLCADTRIAFVAIAREDVEEVNGRTVIQVRGGKAVVFDPSLRLRVTAWPIKRGDDEHLVGHRHSVAVFKTKVANRTEQIPEGIFHTSNGVEAPAGLHRAMDLLELGQELGVVELAGAWYSFDGRKLGQGEEKAAAALTADFVLADAVEAACRARFGLKVES